jgi:outer membrane biosynthesis protein TonB
MKRIVSILLVLTAVFMMLGTVTMSVGGYEGEPPYGEPEPDPPVVTDEPVVTEEPEVTEPPEETTEEPPEVTEPPVVTEPPGLVERTDPPPVVTDAPEITESPVISEAPVNNTQAPQVTRPEDYEFVPTTPSTETSATIDEPFAGAAAPTNGIPPTVLYIIAGVLIAGIAVATPLIVRGVKLERIYRY